MKDINLITLSRLIVLVHSKRGVSLLLIELQQSSCPGKFYGNAKVHKLLTNNVDDLPLRPIISNIGTATYETAKYLANLLAPLGKSKYTITNTKEFVKYIQKTKSP